LSGDVNNAFYGVAGNWIAWLEYNIRRSLGETSGDIEEQQEGAKKVIETINLLSCLKKDMNSLSLL